MEGFGEFASNIEREKEKAHQMAWFVLSTVFDGEIKWTKEQIDVAKYLIDRREGKAAQKNIHSGDKENPIVFMPSEIMVKNGITSNTENSS